MTDEVTRLKTELSMKVDYIHELVAVKDDYKKQLADYESLMKKYNVEDLGHLDIMLFVLSGETKYQLAQLKQQLAEKDAELNRYAELFGMKDKDFYIVEKTEYDKMIQGAKEIVNQLRQQLKEKDRKIKELESKGGAKC